MWRDSTHGKAADFGVEGPGFKSWRGMIFSTSTLKKSRTHEPNIQYVKNLKTSLEILVQRFFLVLKKN